MAKLRLRSSRGSRKGVGEVRLCTANTQNAAPAIAASAMISGDSNQSRRCPRSIISCKPAIATESARNPVQSSRAWVRAVLPARANQMKPIAIRPGGTIMKNTARQPTGRRCRNGGGDQIERYDPGDLIVGRRKRASDLWQDDIGQGDRHAEEQARQLHG